MKKQYITSLILVGLMPFLTHCASQQDLQNLNYHVRSINKKLDDMKVNTVDQMQQRQAMSSGQLDQLQADILQLRSKLDENAHMNRMVQEKVKELELTIHHLSNQQEEKLALKMAELGSKIASQKKSLTAIQQARVQDAERRSKAAKKAAADAMRRAQQATLAKTANRAGGTVHLQPTSQKVLFSSAPGANRSTASPVTVTAKQSVPAKFAVTASVQHADTYSKAMQSYRDGKFKEAFGLFEKNASKRSGNPTALTSRYMMGECLFKQGEYDQAIIQYQQIISNFPGNPQAAKALLRQGESFEQLSDNDTARIIYKKIMASYSSSPEAVTAKERMSSL